jgi:hypothetical protein
VLGLAVAADSSRLPSAQRAQTGCRILSFYPYFVLYFFLISPYLFLFFFLPILGYSLDVAFLFISIDSSSVLPFLMPLFPIFSYFFVP